MIDQGALNVWFEDRLVGYLWVNAIDYIGFRYDTQWIKDGGFPVSRTLPLHNEEYSEAEGVAHRYFANLLPEGGVRDRLVRDWKIPNTDFALLQAIGGECAGALSLLPVEQEPSREFHYLPLNEDDMLRLVKTRGKLNDAHHGNRRPRLSLAGAQDKCAVKFSEERYFNPVDDAPSTHILKFDSPEYRHLPLYEVFTSWLAREAGLLVVDTELVKVKGKSYVRIERYDRKLIDETVVLRLHQEDFCQALGFSHIKKYQHDGGPDFADCLNLLREYSDNPAEDIRRLLHWQIFNVLAGNSDGHAKNLSLLYAADGSIRLTPFYDMLCTRAISRIDANLAFAVGTQRNPSLVNIDDWTALARQCDIGGRFMLGLVQGMAETLLQRLPDVRQEFETAYAPGSVLQRVEKIVRQQCKLALEP